MNQDALTAAITAAVAAAVAQALADLPVDQPAAAPAVTQPKADPKPAKAYRSTRTKEEAHRRIGAINARYDLKLAGGKRRIGDLSAKERAAYDAEVKAVWAKARKTRTTKAA